MTDERFNELLNGPLSHPTIPFMISRLALAVKAVVDATGAAGEFALEEHCAERQRQDERLDDLLDNDEFSPEEGGAA